MLNPLTAFVARLQSWFNQIGGTSIYGRELNWEDMPAIPVVNVGYAGATSTGKPKIWPNADSTGYFPTKTTTFMPYVGGSTSVKEVAVGTPVVSPTGDFHEVTVIKPAAATLEIAAAATATIPATSQDLVFTFRKYGAVTFTAGVASSFVIFTTVSKVTETTVSR